MLTITKISNERRNKLTIYTVLCRNVTIFTEKRTSFFIFSTGKIENMQEFKVKLFE